MGIAYIAAWLREKQYIVDIIEIRDASDIKAVLYLIDHHYDVYGFTTTCITLQYVV